ncbi:MAG: spore maturation protein [Bacillota bacterium]
MVAWFLTVSQWSIPLLLLIILGYGRLKKIHLYEVFIEGALEGLKTTIRLTPYILAIFIAVGIFRASGGLNLVVYLFKPLLNILGIAPDLLTLGMLKPLSGSASLGITAELLNKYGPDTTTGITASLIQGCGETTFYVLSLYLGSVKIRDGRHILVVGLISELAAFIMALCLGPLLGLD